MERPPYSLLFVRLVNKNLHLGSIRCIWHMVMAPVMNGGRDASKNRALSVDIHYKKKNFVFKGNISYALLQAILDNGTIDINLEGDLGNTPIMQACYKDNSEALIMLVSLQTLCRVWPQ